VPPEGYTQRAARVSRAVKCRLPGVLVCLLIALAATFLSEHYGGPQLLYALLIGLAFHFLSISPDVKPGLDLCARTVLRIGVALLGARITIDQVASLGIATGLVIAAALSLTVLLGVFLARLLGQPRELGLLTGGSVAICGASAAMAIASVLPQTRDNERFTLLTVVGVAVLSTLSMIVYPFFLLWTGTAPVASGIFIGGTIHDVAQVVAAGMLLGPQAGDVATIVKLFRVMLLLPVVLAVTVLYRNAPGGNPDDAKVPVVPGFLLAFIVLVLLATTGMFSAGAQQLAGDASRWMLVTAIAAAGIKTSFSDLLKLGWQPLAMLVGETIFIAMFVMIMILGLRLGA